MRTAAALLTLISVAATFTAFAEGDGCDDCAPAFQEHVAALEALGYSASEYEILLSWTERTAKPGLNEIRGYHLRPRTGSGTLDVYADQQGHLLDEPALRKLGVQPKNWDIKPVEAMGEKAAPHAALKTALPEAEALGPMKGAYPTASVEFPPVDREALLAEDAQDADLPKSARRIGVVRELPEPLVVENGRATLGEWQTLPSGERVLSVALWSPEAEAIRVRFAELTLPEDAEAVVYNADAPQEVYGPYTRVPAGDDAVWSASCFVDAAVVEIRVPAAASLEDVQLRVDAVAHAYVALDEMAYAKAAGWCNLDVTCYPAWADAATGVGRMSYVSGAGLYSCTGTLIVDMDPATDIPYFLTANHCISSQTSASNLEVYWLYQTSTCNGVAPTMTTRPKTTGADYVVGVSYSAGTDFTLLRLRQAPPESLARLGWSTTSPDIGTDVVCIHHPQGDYKRISFADIVSQDEDYHDVVWNMGTTEPGSSGSPLFLASTQQIVGQLFGGLASCSNPGAPDHYGRFDVSFPLAAPWLDPMPEDINKSGGVDAVDVQIVINVALGLDTDYNGDVDGSGVVDAVDIQLVINGALGV